MAALSGRIKGAALLLLAALTLAGCTVQVQVESDPPTPAAETPAETPTPTAALNKRPARRRPPKQRVRGNHKWQRQAAQKGSQGKNRPPKKAASLPSGVGFTLLRARRLARQTAAGTVYGAASAVRLRISSTIGVSVRRSVKSTCLP